MDVLKRCWIDLLVFRILICTIELYAAETSLINGSDECCSSKSECVYSGDCCYDAFKKEHPGKGYFAYFLEKTKVRKYFRKVPIINKKLHPSHKIVSRYMISTCDDTSSPYHNICNYNYTDEDLPVHDTAMLVYRNLACAKCHNKKGVYTDVYISIRCGPGMGHFFNMLPSNEFSLVNLRGYEFDLNNISRYKITERFSERLKLRETFFRTPIYHEEPLCVEKERAVWRTGAEQKTGLERYS